MTENWKLSNKENNDRELKVILKLVILLDYT